MLGFSETKADVSIDKTGRNYRESPLDTRRRFSLTQCCLLLCLLWFFSKMLVPSLRVLFSPTHALPFLTLGKFQVRRFWLSPPQLIGKVEKEDIPWVTCLFHQPGHLLPNKGHPRFSHLHPWNLLNLIISALDQFPPFLFSFQVVHSLFNSDS